MTGNVDDELVALAIVIAVVGVVIDVVDDHWVFLAVRFFVRLSWAGGAQLQNFVLKRPAASAVGRIGCDDCFVGVLGSIVKVALQVTAMARNEREIVGLHALGSGVRNLYAVRVAVASGLQTVSRAGLF